MVQIGQLSIISAQTSDETIIMSFALGKLFRRVLTIDNQYVSYTLHYYCNKLQHIECPGIVRCSNNCIELGKAAPSMFAVDNLITKQQFVVIVINMT